MKIQLNPFIESHTSPVDERVRREPSEREYSDSENGFKLFVVAVRKAWICFDVFPDERLQKVGITIFGNSLNKVIQ